MRLIVTVKDKGDRAFDLDPSATVGDMLDALEVGGDWTFEVSRTGLRLDRGEVVASSDIRSGDVVEVVRSTGAASGAGRPVTAAAVLRVVAGPNAGASYPLRFGVNTIGRDDHCDVTLLDSLASRLHAKVHVGDMVTIADAGSTNGVTIGNDAITQPSILQAGDHALVGDSWIQVEHHNRTPDIDDISQNTVDFNRPPRISQPYPGKKIELPVPPEDVKPQRLPMMSALAPLLMLIMYGGLFWFFLRIREETVDGVLTEVSPWDQRNIIRIAPMMLFMLMSPMMMFGSYIERKRSGRIEFEHERDEFRATVATRLHELDVEARNEYESRHREAPRADEMPGVVAELSGRLWERGSTDPDLLTVRLGRADQPSRIQIDLRDGGSKELRREVVDIPDRYEIVADVPVLVDLVEAGGLGISGLPDDSIPVALSVMSQLAALHSPSELLIAGLVGEGVRPRWAWMKWLPHINVENSPLDGPHLASTADTCNDLLARIDRLIVERRQVLESGSTGNRFVAPGVVVLVDESMTIERHRLVHLMESGPRVGVFFVWVASARHRLPRSVGAYIDIAAKGVDGVRTAPTMVGYTTSDEVISPVQLEPIDIRTAATVSRALAPVRDISGRFAAEAQVPQRVNLVDLLDGPRMLVDPSTVLQRWAQESRSLRAPVGATAGAPFSLDIRHDGPHALVAGTTGAGKSELLQSWIASLALTYGPEKITFLLVDYKGGSAFKDINHLPHTVGMVTDLDTNGVRRALVSLNAEVHHRERILADANCSDLAEMEEKKLPGAPPSLLIVVDEFAALVQEVPEFVEGMVNVAQRGRSLGLHLILATQRPGGVITPQVRANTNLRIALRMADESESTDVVNSKIAANIERALPGRGVARIGPKELITFQSAYVGGVTDPDAIVETVEVGEFTMDGVKRITRSDGTAVEADTVADLEKLVDVANRAQVATGRSLPRKPWLNPLGDLYELAMLPRPDSDQQVLLGAIDLPEAQQQAPFVWRPDDDGSVALVGASGSGKTVALSTFAASVAFCGQDPIPSIYALDFAGRGLSRIENLPHVAAVVLDDDEERLRRVLVDLEKTLNDRARRFAEARAGSLDEYRSLTREPLNRQYLLIDGLSSFYDAHDNVGVGRLSLIVQRLIREGRQFGIHVVAATTRRQDVGTAFSRAFNRWIVLRQGSADDYRNLEVDTDVLNQDSPAGRAMFGRDEAQIAVLGGSPFGDVQSAAMEAFAQQLRERGVHDAEPVRTLPWSVVAADVPSGTWCIDDDSLGPVPLPSPLDVLQISGPRGSGKSMAMWRAVECFGQRVHSVDLFTAKPPALPVPAGWKTWQPSTEGAGARLTELAGGGGGRLVLLDDLGPLTDSMLSMQLEELIRQGRSPGLTIMLTIENVDGRASFKPVIREVRSYRTTLLLRPDPLADGEIAGTELPRMKTHSWPPGRGFLAVGNSIGLVQMVAPQG